jgi:thioredoxin-like negative regulator of GroEL
MDTRPEQKPDSISPAQSGPEPFVPPAFATLTEGGFHARLAATPGVGVVLFSAPRCGACRIWKRLLPEALAGIAQAFYEVDVGEATGVARYYGIFHLPAIHLYRDGRFHAELQCEANVGRVRETATWMLKEAAREEP